MVVVVVLLVVVDTEDVPGFGSLSIAVLWSLNLLLRPIFSSQKQNLADLTLAALTRMYVISPKQFGSA